MFKKYNDLLLILIIFVFAIFTRMTYFAFIMDIKIPLHLELADQRLYDSIATTLLASKEFAVSPRAGPIGIVLPVYPLFLAGIYAIFGHSLVAVRCVQSLISGLSCVLVFIIAKKIFNKTTALISGLLLAVSPPMIYLSGALLNECLFIFIILLAMFFAVRFKINNSYKDNIYFSIFLGISMLTKEIMLPFVFFLVSWYLAISESLKKGIQNFLVAILIIIILFTPWTIRSYKVYRDAFPTISMAAGALWEGNHPSAKGYHIQPEAKDWQALGLPNKPKNPIWGSEDGLTEAQRRKLYSQLTLNWLMKNPQHFLKLMPLKFIYFWGPITQTTSDTAKRFSIIYSVFYSIIIILAVFGAILSRGKIKDLLLIYLLFIYFTIVACSTVALTRFRLPLEPFYIMLASYSLSKLILKLKGI